MTCRSFHGSHSSFRFTRSDAARGIASVSGFEMVHLFERLWRGSLTVKRWRGATG